MYSVSLDYNNQSNTSAFPVSVGNHILGVSYGLDPDTDPIFQSSNSSTTNITSQSGNYANFYYDGNNVGGIAVKMCGSIRYSFIFYKPSGARLAVYPNPIVDDEATVEVEVIEAGTALVPLVEKSEKTLKITKIELYDYKNSFKANYIIIDSDETKKSIKIESNWEGIFYLRAYFSDGTSQTKRILIQK